MKLTLTNACSVVAGVLVLGAVEGRASLSAFVESPGVQASTLPGVVTETFDTLPTGALGPYAWYNGAQLVGTLTAGGTVLDYSGANQNWGGADKTQYYAVGAQSGGTLATLTFAEAQSYFGLWWPAVDGDNRLNLYNGSTLLGSYTKANFFVPLSLGSAYYGNPNNGYDSSEMFAYVNFVATGGDVITKIEFVNTTGTGFEMDNFSVKAPDAGSSLALLGGACAMIGALGRRFRK